MSQHATNIATRRQLRAPATSSSLLGAEASALHIQAAADPQRTLGNSALARHAARNAIGGTTVQAKMMLGPAHDSYEQEADNVASQIMQRFAAPAATAATATSSVQRHGDEEEIQMKPMITPLVQRESEGGEEEEEELQAKLIDSPLLQRHSDEEELQAKRIDSPLLQRHGDEEEELQASRAASADLATTEVDGALESQIRDQRGGGSPLPDTVRSSMESGFGADFSGVRVHQNTTADHLNRSLQARAFTSGNDIFFRGGEYNPGSRQGQQLLAHELTHVVQQGAAVQKKSAKDEYTP